MQRTLCFVVCLIGAAIFSPGCAESRTGRVAASNGIDFGSPNWTQRELAMPIARREVRRTDEASHHIVRLAGAETPHVHDRHDLTVFVLSGKVRVHMADSVWIMQPGDVAQIPHGLTHHAEHIGPGDASEAYVVITPPFDGKDSRPINDN